MAMPLWLREKLFQKSLLRRADARSTRPTSTGSRSCCFTEHHQSHAASAFYPSPFEEQRSSPWTASANGRRHRLGVGAATRSTLIEEIHFPHSLGLLYSAFTYYTGFKVNSGEYKVMGLAPYGEPKYAQAILDNLIDIKADGSFRSNMDYFDYCTGLTHDQRQVRRPVRRPAAQTRRAC